MSHPMLDGLSSGSQSALLSADRVVGWRRWRLRPGGAGELQLGSAHEDQLWPGRTLRAECDPSRTWAFRMALPGGQRGAHQPPAAGCRCGIHAYRTPELARPIGPGVWVYGRVLILGPIFVTDTGYRGREATIDGPLELTVECVGGDDLFSPTRCFEPPAQIRHDREAFYPICSSHPNAPVGVAVEGTFDLAEFVEAATVLATRLETVINPPAIG